MKKLNILFAIVVTTLSFSAQAESPRPLPSSVSVASGAIPITWTWKEISHADGIVGCFRVREEAAIDFYRIMSQEENLREMTVFYRGSEYDKPVNIDGSIQYACKEVVIKTTAQYNGLNRTGVKSEAFCIPRPLSEKQIISFAKKCEINPVETCFSENVLRRLDSVKPTKVTMDHTSICTVAKK